MGVAAFVGSKEMTCAGPRLLLCAGYAKPHRAKACHRPAASLPADVAFGTDPADGGRFHERLVRQGPLDWKRPDTGVTWRSCCQRSRLYLGEGGTQ